MKFTGNVLCSLIILLLASASVSAQLYKIDLNNKINKSSLIVEGKVISQYSFWNDEHTIIYTANKVHIHKLFKGKLVSGEIEVITEGGSVGNRCLKVSDVLELRKNEKGMFFFE